MSNKFENDHFSGGDFHVSGSHGRYLELVEKSPLVFDENKAIIEQIKGLSPEQRAERIKLAIWVNTQALTEGFGIGEDYRDLIRMRYQLHELLKGETSDK